MEEQKNVNINGAENESAETEAENAEKKEAAKLSLGRLFYLTVLNKKKKLVKA